MKLPPHRNSPNSTLALRRPRLLKAFISYSHEDAVVMTKLSAHLTVLRREGLLDTWTDREIHAGGVIDDHVDAAMEEAELFLLLVSASFIHSEYCYAKEFARARERHAAGEVIIVPIIVRECDWKIAELRKFKALPDDGKAVTADTGTPMMRRSPTSLLDLGNCWRQEPSHCPGYQSRNPRRSSFPTNGT